MSFFSCSFFRHPTVLLCSEADAFTHYDKRCQGSTAPTRSILHPFRLGEGLGWEVFPCWEVQSFESQGALHRMTVCGPFRSSFLISIYLQKGIPGEEEVP